MSPEHVKNTRNTDLRTDIWALGAILYELIAGVPTFDGETAGEIFAAVLQETPKPLASFVPDMPAGLQAIISRCLDSNRDARYASALEPLFPRIRVSQTCARRARPSSSPAGRRIDRAYRSDGVLHVRRSRG